MSHFNKIRRFMYFGARIYVGLGVIRQYFIIRMAYKTQFVLDVADVLIGALSWGLLGSSILYQAGLVIYGDASPIGFLLSGLMMDFIIRQVTAFASFLTPDNFEDILLRPVSFLTTTVLANFINLMWNGMSIIIYLVTAFFLEVSFEVNFPSLFAVMLFTILIAIGIGLLSSGVQLMVKRGNPIDWIMNTLVGLVSGKLFPITILPPFVQVLSWCLPYTWVYFLWRLVLFRNIGFLDEVVPSLPYWSSLTVLAAFTLLFLILGYKVWQRGINKCKIEGVLS